MPSDHLILFPANSVRNGSNGAGFFQRDWSMAWVNFLLQEVGVYETAVFDTFDFRSLSQYRFVYLPASLKNAIGAPTRELLRAFAEDGGTVIAEGPAANPPASDMPLNSITRVAAGACPSRLAECLKDMPVRTRGWNIAAQVPAGSEVLLEMNGMPVLFRQSVGRGQIFHLGFDFGLLLVSFQQGIPRDGERRLKKVHGTQQRVIEPEDMVADASLLDNSVPYADLFERFFYKVLTAENPAPRWWYFPGHYRGALISTHDEEAIGGDPRIEEMRAAEESLGVKGTYFLISDKKLARRWSESGGLGGWVDKGMEVALHWNRFQIPRLKVRRFKFGMHEVPLEKQKRFLEREAGESVTLNRNHYLAMGTEYGEHFECLASEGIQMDSSYGPNQGGRGYLFGTGYPYYGFTWNGINSGVLEIPFVTQEAWGKADLDFVHRLLAESDENFHQCLVILFHPHYMVREEKGREMWLGALRLAGQKGQWMPTMKEFYAFFRQRSQSRLGSTLVGSRLDVRCESVQKKGCLAFPADKGGRRISGVLLDGNSVDWAGALNGWSEEALVAVPPGEHTLTVHYAN